MNSSAKIRDFSEKQYGNHMFARAPLVPRAVVFGMVFLIAAGFGTFLFIRSPWFFVHDVHVEGLEYINEDAVRGVVEEALSTHLYVVIPFRNRVFFNPATVQAKLMEHFAFDAATVTRSDATVTVRVKEKPTGVLVTDGKRAVFTDLSGTVTRDATEEEITLTKAAGRAPPFLVLTTETPLASPTTGTIFTPAFLQNYLSLKLHFEVETGLTVLAYVLPHAQANWMKVRLDDGRDIYVDLERDLEPQIQKLLTLLKEKGSEVAKVSYIDLRFLDRIYYK